MMWFGESWGARVCNIVRQAPTPLDAMCARQCGHGIRPGDQGLLLPYFGHPLPGYEPINIAGVPHLAYHLVCFFDEIGIRGRTHV